MPRSFLAVLTKSNLTSEFEKNSPTSEDFEEGFANSGREDEGEEQLEVITSKRLEALIGDLPSLSATLFMNLTTHSKRSPLDPAEFSGGFSAT